MMSRDATMTQAGNNGLFSIQSRDQFGNARTFGGDTFKIGLERLLVQNKGTWVGAVALNGTSKDTGTGRYNGLYSPTVSGFYYMHVRLNMSSSGVMSMQHIKNRPGCTYTHKCRNPPG